jgi:carbamoyl-phosphate synthase large subunit
LVSVKEKDREPIGDAIRDLAGSGFKVLGTPGTAGFLNDLGITAEPVPKVGHGHPDVVERIESGDVDLVINTVDSEPKSIRDSASIRRSALLRGIPYCTTVAGARASVGAILALQAESIGVRALQEIHS